MTSKPDSFRIIGIGASAGGLEALKAFFDNVPADTNHAFVIIQHLSPDYKSLMAELLAKNTDLPIQQAKDKTTIKSGSIYLIPPKKNMTVESGVLRLTDKPDGHDLNLPIDIFFRSLAKDQGESSIAVILSGTGSDGTRGGRVIKDAGGAIFIQEPSSAKFDGMPSSAVHAGIVDFSLPVSDIPESLEEFIKHQFENDYVVNNIEKEEETLIRILKHVNTITGKNFLQYKRPTLARRLERRMAISRKNSLKAYLEFIYENPAEVYTLAQEFLIGVTKFFRDSEVWETLEKKVLTNLVKEKGSTLEQLRIWNIGCSTGEEVYTTAMLVHEIATKLQMDVNLKVFATDIEKSYIDKAGKGTYPESIVADISPLLLKKYFNGNDGNYVVSDMIRRNIIFSQHNILQDPPFNNIDLVICRNLLIYMNNEAQQKALSVMQYALRLKGNLLLGPSESLGELEKVFSEVDRKQKIYCNEQISRTVNLQSISVADNKISPAPKYSHKPPAKDNEMAELLNNVLADEMGLAAVYIDKYFNIVHAVGELRQYVELPKSGFTTNLMKILPENVGAAINTAVRKLSVEDDNKVLYKNIEIQKGKLLIKFDILVTASTSKTIKDNFSYMILFTPREKKKTTAKVIKRELGSKDKERVLQLEHELKDTRENLQATIEEVETTNEELQATNEEMLAANEELQSTNEELQSLNKELHTVNTEYQQKIEDLASLNADMDNLLISTEIGTIFLDKDLNLRKFTPSVKEQFNFRESDIGRPLTHFTSNLSPEDNKKLVCAAQLVTETAKTNSLEIKTKNEIWYLTRITPFRNSAKEIEGVVISFININSLKSIEHKYASQNAAFEQVLEGTMAGYWDWYIQDDVEYLSPTFKKMFGYKDSEMKNHPSSWQKIVHQDDLPSVLEIFDQHVKSKGKIPFNTEVRYFHKNGSIVWVYCRGKVIEWGKDGKPIRMVGSHVDITHLKQVQSELEKSNEDLKQFAYITSHDLQEPLNTLINFSKLLMEDYKGKLDDEANQCLGFIESSATRMSQQIRSLLEFSRLGRNEHEEILDLNDVSKEVLMDLDSAISLSEAKITVSKLPKIKASDYDIRTLFMNLISNAIKYKNSSKKPNVKLSAKKEKDYWKFTIADNGIGIEQIHHKKIFQIFQRLHGEEDFKGEGIGLANCKKIISNLGGKIWVESTLGKGSKFHFTLPQQRIVNEK